jgi:ADYC domain-containing protein
VRSCLLCAVLFWWAVGCQATAPVAPSLWQREDESEDSYTGHQGRLLLGFNDPTITGFTFDKVTDLQVRSNGELVAKDLDDGHALEGGEFKDFKSHPLSAIVPGGTLAMRITDIKLTSGTWVYSLEQLDPISGKWGQACAQPPQLYPPAMPPSPPFAVAMAGSWTADGTYIRKSPSMMTFACSTGVAAKCYAWGYPPSQDLSGITLTGVSRSAAGADLLLTCTGMARADYCGTGVPHTVDGTPIHLYDIFGGPIHPEKSQPGFSFEAAWLAQAISIADGPSTPRPALCLSKLRWATLPINGECPLVLPDPRVDPKGRFCDDYLDAPQALIYNDSQALDAGLYTWTRVSPAGSFTTSRLQPQPIPSAPERLPGLTVPSSMSLPPGIVPSLDEPHFEGALFRPDLAISAVPGQTILLSSYFCPDDPNHPGAGADYVTTTTTPPHSTCQLLAAEGYVYSPATTYAPGTPNRVPLNRWSMTLPPGLLRSRTTTTDAATMQAHGWSKPVLEGYLPR